jgi:hypothetical protein
VRVSTPAAVVPSPTRQSRSRLGFPRAARPCTSRATRVPQWRARRPPLFQTHFATSAKARSAPQASRGETTSHSRNHRARRANAHTRREHGFRLRSVRATPAFGFPRTNARRRRRDESLPPLACHRSRAGLTAPHASTTARPVFLILPSPPPTQ